MQCSMSVRASGNKMKTNGYKNPYKKETNLDNIVDQLCTRLEDIKDKENTSRVGMPTIALEHSEAVRRYYAAFPALNKGQESPEYCLPPPAWCRKPQHLNMQSEELTKDWNKNKKSFKLSFGKELRSTYHRQKKNKKRCNSYGRLDNKESLPEWVTHEGVWDMESQDPVKEFIRAIALDEGYGTCENTVIEERPPLPARAVPVPDWDDSLDLDADWIIHEDLKPRQRSPLEEEIYAKFEAKFDRSIEALWAKDQNTPDDEYQELPIDFQDLLSSPSDHMFGDPSAEKCSLVSLTDSIWSNDGLPERADSASWNVESLHTRLQPLQLGEAPPPPPPLPPPPRPLDAFLYEGPDIYEALHTVASTLRSLTALNHSRDNSGFVEVPPRTAVGGGGGGGALVQPPPAPARLRSPSPGREREDLLTSSRTHFRPIKREAEAARYRDGDTFDIRGSLERVPVSRSDSGSLFVGAARTRYLEYRGDHTVDYGRLRLSAAQCGAGGLGEPAFRLRFPLRQRDAAVQTDPPAPALASPSPPAAWAACDECGATAKKMRPSAMASIWAGAGCAACRTPAPAPPPPPAADSAREWEELLSDISAAHADYLRADIVEETLVSAERKRRHSAALRCSQQAGVGPAGPEHCSHPHARFLHCCALALDRPLTR